MAVPADLPSPPGGRGVLRHWLPSPAAAAGLLGLIGLTAWLHAAVVTGKALTKAGDRWQEARAPGSSTGFKWEDAAVLGTHWSATVALVVLILSLLTLRWWWPAAEQETVEPEPRRARWFLPALAGVVLVAGALRVPLAAGSLWWDELWNIKNATVGEWRQEAADPDVVRFHAASWSRAAWYYNKPTNHPVLTLPSKAAHLVWRALTRPADPGAFCEVVLRLPVLLAGLGALVLTALLACRLAGERAGLLAAGLMGLHPWLIRYGVDARGYGMTILFTAAALFSLERAGRRGAAAGWWGAFAACQFFLMWAHMVANLAVCAGLFTAAASLIWRGGTVDRGRQLARLVVFNLIAAALLLVAFLPNLLQALTWGERNDDGNLLTGTYFLKTLTQIASGMEPPPGTGTPGIPFLAWGAVALLAGGGAAVAGAGLGWLFRHRGRMAWGPAAVLAGVAGFLVIVRLTDFYFYHRFILTAAVPLVLLVAIGLSRLQPGWLSWGAVAGFAVLTFPQTWLLLTRSYAPFRETVADLRAEALRLPGGKVIPVAYGLGSHVMQCYYPELRDIRKDSAAALEALIAQARRENRPLVLALGYEALNRLLQPEGFPLLDDPALFERVSTRHGIEPEFTFHLMRLKPPVP